MVGWFVGGLLALVLVYGAVVFNRLVGLNRRADGAWSDIDVQLKRRWDLVPALVETVKGYAKHESETFEAVIQARNQAVNAEGPAAAGQRALRGRGRQVPPLPLPAKALDHHGSRFDMSPSIDVVDGRVAQY